MQPNHPKLFDFSFESTKNIDDVKSAYLFYHTHSIELIVSEINDLKASQNKKSARSGDNSAAAARKAYVF